MPGRGWLGGAGAHGPGGGAGGCGGAGQPGLDAAAGPGVQRARQVCVCPLLLRLLPLVPPLLSPVAPPRPHARACVCVALCWHGHMQLLVHACSQTLACMKAAITAPCPCSTCAVHFSQPGWGRQARQGPGDAPAGGGACAHAPGAGGSRAAALRAQAAARCAPTSAACSCCSLLLLQQPSSCPAHTFLSQGVFRGC